jgi:hypothetical protein
MILTVGTLISFRHERVKKGWKRRTYYGFIVRALKQKDTYLVRFGRDEAPVPLLPVDGCSRDDCISHATINISFPFLSNQIKSNQIK